MAGQEPRYWDAVEKVWDVINIYDGPDVFLASFAKVPRPVGIVYAAHFLLSEVHNGGFLQFFKNSTGVLAPEALEGFYAIGMPQLASVVSEALNILGPEYPRDRKARWDAMIQASPLSEKNIEQIFKETKDMYQGFAKLTAPLPFDDLSKQVWELAATENGDFGNAATNYLLNGGLLSRQ